MSGLKVLIFEYDRPFADALERAFARRGCTVRVVDDGQQGLEVALDDRPGLIVLAIELPRMNGFAVCNRIKKNPELKDIPLVIVSSDSPPETFEQHSKLRTRAEDYLHKPIDPEALIARAAAFVEIPSPRDSEIMVDEEAVVEAADDDAPINLDDDMSGLLANAAFDSIILESNPPPGSPSLAPSAAASLLEAPPELPPGQSEHRSNADDFEDFTMVSSGLELPPNLQDIARAVETTPPPLRKVSITPIPALQSTSSRLGLASPIAPLPSTPPLPVGPSAAEGDRMRRRIEELERDLATAQGATQRVVDLTEENQRLRAQGDELARVTRELEEARRASSVPAVAAAVAAPARPGAVSTREFLELRETLNRKDKEIHARDKEILELRDSLLKAEMSAADVDDRMAEREHEAATARHSSESLQAALQAESARRAEFERALAEARAAGSQGESALRQQLAEAESQRAREVDGLRRELEAAVAAAAAASASVAAQAAAEAALRDEHARALEAARAEARALAQQGEGSARAEMERALEAARSEHAAALSSLRSEHAQLVDSLRSDYVTAVDSTKAEHSSAQAALAAAESSLREQGGRLSSLESELSAARSQGAVLASELSASHEKADAAARDLAAARERLATLERRQASAEALLDRARQALEIAAVLVHAATQEDAKADLGATTEA